MSIALITKKAFEYFKYESAAYDWSVNIITLMDSFKEIIPGFCKVNQTETDSHMIV